jgi:hypothetical protein
MKKVLALVLVLGLASMANAAFVIGGPDTLDTGAVGSYSISVNNQDVANLEGFLTASKGMISNTQVVWAGKMVGFDINDGAGGLGVWANFGSTVAAGIPLFTFDYTAPAEVGVVSLLMEDAATYGGSFNLAGDEIQIGAGSLLVNVVPEPMTMSLLALGGLGLLRRRR